MKKFCLILLAVMLIAAPSYAAKVADVAFVIDQSGSMGGEFSWLGNSIANIDTAMQSAGITTKYGVAGYEYYAGTQNSTNAWTQLTSSITDVVNEVNSVGVYGGTERHYHAADWAADNFAWTTGAARVMVLITDEPGNYLTSYAYDGLTGEAAIAKKMADNNILLNVVTFKNYYQYWDTVAFVNPTTSFQGLFDLEYLRTDPQGFTNDFQAAKIAEIIITPVPEPGTILLLGTGLMGLALARRRR